MSEIEAAGYYQMHEVEDRIMIEGPQLVMGKTCTAYPYDFFFTASYVAVGARAQPGVWLFQSDGNGNTCCLSKLSFSLA